MFLAFLLALTAEEPTLVVRCGWSPYPLRVRRAEARSAFCETFWSPAVPGFCFALLARALQGESVERLSHV